MRSSIRWFNLTALVASVMVLIMATILVPEKSWSNAAITSIVIFALSIGFVFYVPSVVKPQGAGDAAPMASLGPLGIITGWMLLVTAGAFVLALLGMDKLAWAMVVLSIGSFMLSGLLLRAASDVVGNVAKQYSSPSKHIYWQREIQGLSSATPDGQLKNSLANLAEKLRYTASDVLGGSPQDGQIDGEIKAIVNLLAAKNSANVQNKITQIEVLMSQRDIFLRSARDKS